MRRLRRLGIVLVLLAAVLVAWEPTRVGLQTAVMLPNLLGAPVRPLDVFSSPPRREAVPYRSVPGAGDELAELWLPAWASEDRRAGGMLLVLGVNNVGRNHPVVARVAEGLARSGVAVLVPDSAVLLEGRLETSEIDGVVRAFETLASRSEVDPERVGIVGFSVGGSLAVLAAGDPRVAADVAWVNAFGAFADAATYLAAVSAHAYRGADGDPVAWEPSPLAREVHLRFLLDQVADEADREALGDAAADAEDGRLSASDGLRDELTTEAALAVLDLLASRTLDDAEDAIGRLPAGTRAFIDDISPVRHLGVVADVHLMHETEDHHVPFVESRRLADALRPAGILEAHTEFRLFDHVQPDDLDLVAAAPEIVKLLLHVRELMEETL